MNEVWIVLGVVTGAVVIGAVLVRKKKSVPSPVLKFDSREVRLSRQLARTLDCTVDDVLPSVEQEIELALHVSDETILKRAKYHYQQNLPEKACGGYRDRAVG